MKKDLIYSTILVFLIISSSIFSQSISVEGFNGITFEKRDINYIVEITDQFQLHSMSITPDNLWLRYNHISKTFSMFGGLSFRLNNNIITVSLGDEGSPGIIIENETLTEANLSITAEFILYGFTFTPKNLGINWTKSEENYEFIGSATAVVDNQLVTFNFGNATTPGVTISNGSVDEFNISLDDDLSIHGCTIINENLGVYWNSADSKIEIYGAAKFVMGNSSGSDTSHVSVSFGSLDSAMFVMKDGSIQNMGMTISGDFNLFGGKFSPNGLTIEYSSSSFNLYGSADFTIPDENETVTLLFGGSAENGIIITDGKITQLSLGVTSSFTIKSVEVEPTDLTFFYSEDSSAFKIYGDCKVFVESDTIDVNLGTSELPGFEVSNGKLQDIDFGLTADFKMKGITISPTDLTFIYKRVTSTYEIYGDCKVKFESEEIDVNLGTSEDVGLKISDGSVQHINFGLTADFKLKSLDFSPQGLTFEWDKLNSQFEMYGAANLTVENDEIDIGLGDADTSGIVIKNHKLSSLDVSITSDFKLKGLSINAKDLTVIWNRNTDQFEIYGSAGLNFSGDDVDVDFGNSSNPGIVLKNDSLKSFNIAVTSDINLGALDVQTNSLGVSYNTSTKKYFLSGSVTVDAVYSLTADFGDDGIEIDASAHPDKLIINDLTVQLDNAKLGAIDLKKIKLTFDEAGISDVDLKVSFPPGYEVAADMAFVIDSNGKQKLNEISLDFEATSFDDIIEIPGTGVGIMKMSGSLDNLDTPSDLKFHGDVILTAAGPVSLEGYKAALAEMECTLDITKTHFDVTADVNVGAYKDGSEWKNLLGSGSLYLYVKSNKSTTLKFNAEIPKHRLVKIDSHLKMDSHKDISALLKVTFYVPHFVPFIHGKKLGGVDGAIRWINKHMDKSYVAAWKHYHYSFVHGHVGAKYTIGTKKLKKIGSGTIKDIKREIRKSGLSKTITNQGIKTENYTNIVHTFKIESPSPQFIELQIDAGQIIDSAYVTVTGPEGIYELVKLDVIEESIEEDTLKFNTTFNFSQVRNDSTVYMALLPPNSKPSDLNNPTKLTEGEYQFTLSYADGPMQIDSLDLVVHSFYPSPKGTLKATQNNDGSYNLNLNYYSYLQDSINVAFYWNDSLKYKGHFIDSEICYNETDTGYVNATLTVRPEVIENGENIYFYAMIEDGINPPYVTQFSNELIHQNPISGKVYELINEQPTPSNGIMVFVDETGDGEFNSDSKNLVEYSSVTDSNGVFQFNESLKNSNRIDAVIPYGYVLDESSPNTFPYIFDKEQGNVNLIYYIRKKDGGE